jgi:CIC family chloride channel protein
MLTIIIATITARTVFRQRGIFVELLSAQGFDYDAHLNLQHLDRVGIASTMERNIVSLPPMVTVAEARSALLDTPAWIVVEGPHGPYFVLNPMDLERHLESLGPAGLAGKLPTVLTRDPAHEQANIDLKDIPAMRLDVVSIDFQATLREAWERLQRGNAEALCIRRVLAPMVAPTLGVLTREACNRLVQTGD